MLWLISVDHDDVMAQNKNNHLDLDTMYLVILKSVPNS